MRSLRIRSTAKKIIIPAIVFGALLSFAAQGYAAELTNPLGTHDVRAIIGNVIKAVLGITGSLALLMFVWGGLLWMTARGEDAHIKQGRETMIWATLGLVVIFGSYAIVKFVLETLLKP